MPYLLPKIAQDHRLQGHTEVQGIRIAIENRKGSVREGTTPDGRHWQTKMKRPYGYLVGTKGADDEPVDVYVGPSPDAPDAYVVHQHKPDGTGYDEDKIMIGFDSKEDARKAFLEHYDSDKFLGPISRVPVDRLKELVDSKRRLVKISAVRESGFVMEMRKLAYETAPNRYLVERLLNAIAKPRITPDDRRVILEAARRISEGADPRIRLLTRLRGG